MNELRQINRKEWPPLINEIAEHIGDEAAMNLFVRFAGRRLRPPKRLPPDHVINSIIGEEKAQIISRIFGDEIMDFPTGKCLLIKIRNQRIFKAYKDGMSQADLATLHQITQRQINQIIRQHKCAEKEKMIHEHS
jgi:hypothetical protein